MSEPKTVSSMPAYDPPELAFRRLLFILFGSDEDDNCEDNPMHKDFQWDSCTQRAFQHFKLVHWKDAETISA